MKLGIEFLYLLQLVRMSCGSIFDNFILFITDMAGTLPCFLVLALIYWCLNKELGRTILLNLSFGCNINSILKNHFRIPRPWLRDPRIVPVSGALYDAAGYSLPSGHVTRAMATYGVIGMDLSRRGAKKEYTIQQVVGHFAWVLVGLVMFSRLYLGVHTPLDVFVALGLGFLWMLVLRFAKFFLHNEVILVAGVMLAIYSIHTYGLNGNVGMMLGLLGGWYTEDRWLRFSTEGEPMEKALRFILGGGLLILILELVPQFISVFTLTRYANFVAELIAGVFVTVIYPLCFHLVHARHIPLKQVIVVNTCFLLVLVVALGSFGYYWTQNPRLLAEEDADRSRVYEAGGSVELAPGEVNTVDFPANAMNVVADGGYATQYPTNSYRSFENAMAMGATSLRCDVQMTYDGQLVLYRELTLEQIDGSSRRIADCTYEELKELDFGAWFGAEFAGGRIMNLAQFLRLVQDRDVEIYLNLVDVGGERRDALVRTLYGELVQHRMVKRATCVSSNYSYLEAMRSYNSVLPVMYETTSGTVDILDSYPADGYSILVDNITSELVSAIHSRGESVYVYDVTGPTQLLNVYRLQANGVFSNNYGLASVVSHPEYSLLCENYEASYTMPGLYGSYVPRICDDMICQGMARTSNHLIVSAYSYSGNYNSILYVMDLEGNLKKIIDLGFRAHVGGMAYDEIHDVLWITAKLGQVYALDWKTLCTAVEKDDKYHPIYKHDGSALVSFDAGLINHKGQKIASFLTFFEGKLYVGSYVNGDTGILNTYEIDDDCKVTLQSSVEIPQRIQGMCFYRDVATDTTYMLLSQSYSVYDSQLLRYVYHTATEKYEYPQASWKLPEGAEQIVMTTRGLYLLFESSAKKYRSTARLANDHIFLIRMGEL
ncbi:MAG: phosphatase PAP2 family protein [Lachnospiraceae bacterium]|nr:phosphatase PAP2 family protein [Lachnospiraceae bacterium]